MASAGAIRFEILRRVGEEEEEVSRGIIKTVHGGEMLMMFGGEKQMMKRNFLGQGQVMKRNYLGRGRVMKRNFLGRGRHMTLQRVGEEEEMAEDERGTIKTALF